MARDLADGPDAVVVSGARRARHGRLLEFGVFYTEAEVHTFARLYFDPKVVQDKIYGAPAAPLWRYHGLGEAEQVGSARSCPTTDQPLLCFPERSSAS